MAEHTLLGRLVRLPFKCIPNNTPVFVIRGPLAGLRWIKGSSDNGCWLGSYEQDKQALFSDAVKKLPANAVIYDFGAHVGYYSLVAARLAPTSRVYAFEPSPSNLTHLGTHIERNHFKNIEVLECAVGDSSSEVYFDFGHSSTTGSVSNSGKFKVRQIKVDEEVEIGRLAPPQLIKMDIEGGEFRALQGAQKTLSQFHPILFLATHGKEVHLQCLSLLKSLGYQVEGVGGIPLDQTDEVIATFPKP